MAEITPGVAGLNNYVSLFYDGREARTPGNVRVASKYYNAIELETFDKFKGISGTLDTVDTALEWVLSTYYSPAVVSIRPTQAAEMLPADSKQSALKLAMATYKEMVEIKFLAPNNTAAIGRYEGMLKFIQDKSNVTRAEIETYYRNGIRGVIAEAVDEEFNKISFMLDRTYDSTLSRNPKTGEYTLKYERPSRPDEKKDISAPTLETLQTAMSKNSDFNQACINEVGTQATRFPAIAYASWKPNGVDALALITETITNFSVNPDTNNYNALVGIAARYRLNGGLSTGTFEYLAWESFSYALGSLFPALDEKVALEVLRSRNVPALAAYPSDRRFEVFSARR
jgi:hypothetical protein